MQRVFVAYWSNNTTLMLIAFCAILFSPVPSLLRGREFRRVTLIVSSVFLAATLYEVISYILTPSYFDYAEPMVTTMATNFLNGAGLYHDWAKDGVIVGSLYGPLTFLVQVPFLAAVPSIAASKLPGVLCFVASLGVLWFALGRRLPAPARIVLVALFASFVAQFDDMWYWNRPDSYLILLSALAVLAARRPRPAEVALILGVIAGLGANFKIHAPFYVAPLAVGALLSVPGWKPRLALAGASAGLAAFSFALPSLVFGTGLSRYLANVLVAGRHGLSLRLFLQSAAFAGALSLPPIALSRASANGKVTPAAYGLVAASLAVAALSAKPGSGVPHLMPFAPVSVSLIALALEEREPFDLRRVQALALCTVVLISPMWLYNWWKRSQVIGDYAVERSRQDEAGRFFTEYPDSEMGVGTSLNSSSLKLRVLSGLKGHRSVFDPVNWMDLRFAGEPVSLLAPLLDACRVRSWILPRGETPFMATGFGVPLFDAAFRRSFAENYHLEREGLFYDVWLCGARSRRETTSASASP